jgi:3-deoxy-7-phosphoheptulonate synthase
MENKYPGKDVSEQDLIDKIPLVSKKSADHKTIVRISKETSFGGDNIPLIVGPNLVETKDQILKIAEYAKKLGANMLRGGCFKPLTFPYRSDKYFESGEEGLIWLKEAGQNVGLPIVTEAVSSEQLKIVARYSDMIQIGTRNMQNYPLLIEASKTGLPIMLKRGYGASLRDWLGAAEYILYYGNSNVVLCERGVSVPHTHKGSSRYLLDLQVVPAAQELSHLPVITDPSHACFWASWVEPLARASIAVGADGIMIETHPTPTEAAVDPLQALDEKDLKACIDSCNLVARSIGRSLGSRV